VVYLIYKKKKIQINLNVTNKTTDWLNQKLRKSIQIYEENTL